MLFSELNILLNPNKHYVLAFSGGLDSTVLLHQLICYNQQLRALHVHHGLSPDADNWALHCQLICNQWKIPCDILYIKIDKNIKGIEASARDARYQALFKKLNPGECLLTAQHLDDQCETLLLALKRGSGPAGLSSMPQQRWVNGHLHLRPLLNVSRYQLEIYATEHKLSWIEDISNSDTRYDRNFLRSYILPLLKMRWPCFSTAVARSAALCAEQENLLSQLLAKKLKTLIDDQGALFFPPLLSINEIYRNSLLRRWIAIHGGNMPSRAKLKHITYEVMNSRKDACPCLRFDQSEIRRYRNKLYWLPVSPSITHNTLIWGNRNYSLQLPQNLGYLKANREISRLREPKQNEQIIIRFEAHGYYHLLNRIGGRKIKKLWQELGIPPWQRNRIPLIYYNQTLIDAPGLFTTREGAANNEKGWQVMWIK
ncbi:tRNA lysidine(34) synthetase TilS [Pantoea sp. Aalb]|uniref:tRNA lysidine(34) synthetase TilS n=1 Tax=Pantoea sp. Aalb TaxID=2576762 RepID=UPI0013205CEC|nr:tRNA lysidine(34) synthetase TilS [Pantoea sp. Aalb]MXP67232.1 tRNA lysidine(34) synthetase TilS [Pantoea sp. Aalb]